MKPSLRHGRAMAGARRPEGSGGSCLRVFVLNDSSEFGTRVCQALGLAASVHEEREFDDGEHKARPLAEVGGCDVYVLQSLHGDPLHSANDKLCRLIFFIGALRDAGAARVTAVLPYLAYARMDRRTQSCDPVTTRYVAALFEAVGTDAVMTVDVHNLSAFQNAFRCRTEHIETQALLACAVAPLLTGRAVSVAAPDAGATHRAEAFRQALVREIGSSVGTAFAEKHRSADALRGELLAGDVEGKEVVIVDDLIASGQTLARTATSCAQRGAARVIAAVSHGLFTGDAAALLEASPIDLLLATDTVPPFRLGQGPFRDQLHIVGVAPLLAEAIRLAHHGLGARGPLA
jgi:ribose-phosphate pyrophosphokinase